MLFAVRRDNFDEWLAQRYQALWPELHASEIVDATVEFLVEFVGGGPALEFGVGTGRIASPCGSAASAFTASSCRAMAAELARAMGGEDITVTIGDFATTRVDGPFTLV